MSLDQLIPVSRGGTPCMLPSIHPPHDGCGGLRPIDWLQYPCTVCGHAIWVPASLVRNGRAHNPWPAVVVCSSQHAHNIPAGPAPVGAPTLRRAHRVAGRTYLGYDEWLMRQPGEAIVAEEMPREWHELDFCGLKLYGMDGQRISMADYVTLMHDPDQRRIAEDYLINDIGEISRVSTMLLCTDMSFGLGGPPLIFETMVFADGDSSNDLAIWRYPDKEAARVGHEAVVADLKQRGLSPSGFTEQQRYDWESKRFASDLDVFQEMPPIFPSPS